MGIFEVFNTWVLIRLFGLLSYLFFTLSVSFGMLGQFRSLKAKKTLLFQLHLSSAWAGMMAVLVHMLMLLIDSYQPYELIELLIPFTASYSPILSGVGTIAFLLTLSVIFTSDTMVKLLGRPLWKKIHILVFPAWLGMVIHGLFLGTDSSNSAVYWFYISSIFIVVVILLSAMMQQRKKQEEHTPTKLHITKK
ncbi:ferric reductase-like transmembrane domain-containing protein [Bacillus norwichensis]|uniref:Ferric reductase-like transmembrane domain-containing protein n=1 Tax=Bacillus norwichensis TaxID=2762217 RepID=A0ABR8VSN0_9BACI|nr:ferric reductase-like transmembrane domain-containing protein [Bacillus norwichensis]MBD8007526.1 ferric reductase-like transmembrane domain-containing protein [Bacillus norwichensis]